MSTWTADEIEAVLPVVISAGDTEGVVALVRELARLDVDRAADVLDTIKLGLDIRRSQQ